MRTRQNKMGRLTMRTITHPLRWLWQMEMPEIPEKYRWLGTFTVVSFALAFSMGFLGWAHHVYFLGPGLGDDWSLKPIQSFWHMLGNVGPHWGSVPLLKWGFALLVSVNVIATAGIIMAGYFRYPQVLKQPFSMRILFTFLVMSILNYASIAFTLLLLGVVAWILGVDSTLAFNGFDSVLDWVRAQTQKIPTFMDMPAWVAFLLIMNIGGFFHYWAHRLSHESRLLWLLFHRPHHMTPELIQPAAQAVFFGFPLFLIAAVPYVFVFSAISKFITEDTETVLGFIIIYKMIAPLATTFSHQTALYDVAQRNPFIRALSIVVSEGPYHYLHHSADPDENCPRGNLVNIGGGMFFIWDRVFGTFREFSPHRPAVGLQGSPTLYMNPVRLTFSGLAQIIYELINNKGLINKIKIVLLGSEYLPEKTLDFAVKDQPK